MKKTITIIVSIFISSCSTPIAFFEPMKNSEGRNTFQFVVNSDFIKHHGNGDVDESIKNGLPLYMGGKTYCTNGYSIDEKIKNASGGYIIYGSCK